MDRRQFSIAALASLLASRVALAETTAPASEPRNDPHQHVMDEFMRFPRATIGMLVYPGMFLQDLVGPLTVFEALMNKEIHLVWKDLKPVGNPSPQHRTLIPVTPTTAFKDCPEQLDVLFVPGGVPGTFAMMEDPEVLDFLAERGKTARFVTSVCTGSLILGAAGLLNGYKATSYWSTRDVLKELGAIPTRGRVVTDRNRITGGGVTAGIDFGLTVAAQLTSPSYAQAIQLYLEYDPQPPYNAGSPESAPPHVTRYLETMFSEVVEVARKTAQRSRSGLNR